MRRRTFLFIFMALGWYMPSGCDAVNICQETFCSCASIAHPVWISVNCTLSGSQTLEISEDYLPETTTELDIFGGFMVRINPQSFTKLQDIRRVRILGTNTITVKRNAFLNITSISTILSIHDCESAYISTRSFSQIKGPLMVNISRCGKVTIEKEAFSWILSVSISSVPSLELTSGAFVVDTIAAQVGRHGPEMMILLTDVIIDELPSNTFGSPAAELLLEKVQVNNVKKDAFSAMAYNVVNILNSTIGTIEKEAFAQKTLINNFKISRCKIGKIASKALQSATSNLTIQHSNIETIEWGAININAATVILAGNEINKVSRRGLELNSWNILRIQKNAFGEMQADAIIANYASGASVYDFTFEENSFADVKPDSLKFIGGLSTKYFLNFKYGNNYYAKLCNCSVGTWLKSVLSVISSKAFMQTSYCMVSNFFATCFNAPEENMRMSKFYEEVCGLSAVIKCEAPISKGDIDVEAAKSKRFPSKYKHESFNFKDKRIVTAIICIFTLILLIILMATSITWIKRRGYCINIKNAIISSNTTCVTFFDRQFTGGMDNARSISRLSVNEYSERHRLNEPRIPEQETRLPNMYTEEDYVPVDEKATQTLPEELTKELLESLREKLDDPENYTEAREMIEHLYELIKVEENCNNNISKINPYELEENIYELPFTTTITIGRNQKQMVSVGTRVPSLEKLLPISPYNRQTALCHEYFEPKDYTVHMYAEITGNKDKKGNNHRLGCVPDVIAEQAIPRGPYLQALRERHGEVISSKNVPKLESIELTPPNSNTIRSNRSVSSNSSAKMLNRPLPKKPITDAGEGTSFQIR